jgi:hypothetical protein
MEQFEGEVTTIVKNYIAQYLQVSFLPTRSCLILAFSFSLTGSFLSTYDAAIQRQPGRELEEQGYRYLPPDLDRFTWGYRPGSFALPLSFSPCSFSSDDLS